jgi:hypothetical protein
MSCLAKPHVLPWERISITYQLSLPKAGQRPGPWCLEDHDRCNITGKGSSGQPEHILHQTRRDDRCHIPRNLFWPFHAPHPSKIAQIEYIYKNIINIYIFQKFTNFKTNIRIFINYNYTIYNSIKYL